MYGGWSSCSHAKDLIRFWVRWQSEVWKCLAVTKLQMSVAVCEIVNFQRQFCKKWLLPTFRNSNEKGKIRNRGSERKSFHPWDEPRTVWWGAGGASTNGQGHFSVHPWKLSPTHALCCHSRQWDRYTSLTCRWVIAVETFIAVKQGIMERISQPTIWSIVYLILKLSA